MSGEINATNLVFQDASGEIMGQTEATVNFGGTPIDITTKSAGGWRVLMEGELAGQMVSVPCTFIYNSHASFRAARTAARNGTFITGTWNYVSDATTDESFTGSFMPVGMADAAPLDDKLSTSLTFESSGVVTFIDAVT